MMIRFSPRPALAALALAACAAPAAAQVTLTPRALGMAGAYVADARGQEAVFVNPANLGLSKTPYYSVAVPQIMLGTRFSGTSLGDVPDLINFDDLSEARRGAILSGIPETGMGASLDVRLPMAAVQVGRFAVGVAYTASYRENVGRDVVDLLLNGYQAGRTDYAVGNTGGSHASYYDVAVAYGRKVGPVSVGVTGHWLHGRALGQHRFFEPTFDLEREDIAVELREVHVRGGGGYSFDVGLAAEPAERWVVSAAVANAVSRFRWSEDLYTRHLVLDRADFENGDPMELMNDVRSSREPVDPAAVPVTVYQTAQGLYDGAYLPATLRAGVAYTLPSEKTRVSGAFQGALDDGRLSGEWSRSLAAGVEHRFTRLFQTRAGVASDLSESWMVSGGLSFGPIHVGLARTSEPLGERFGGGSGWTATFGLGMRTNTSIGDYAPAQQ